eukprot:TRINITY_DN29664_c0_g1_i1.p1 TRINITY_DN29664_c0_g1~~TRINITY_DN29664_c0_g1_i1.p1  ORF type:complete len:585 (+),score=85.31 TRINITY_DN29664_c0_g1_i1:154-1908(+)
MRVKFDLNRARLTGLLEEAVNVQADGNGGGSSSSSASPTESDTDATVEFAVQDVILQPLETRHVRFTAVAKREGLLKIQGVTWYLNDQVLCNRELKLPGRRLRKTLEQRASSTGIRSTDLRLELRVRSHVPRLSARLEGWPEKIDGPSPVSSPTSSSPLSPKLAEGILLQGELRSCSLVIATGREASRIPIRSLSVALSHPNCLAFDLDLDGGFGKECSLQVSKEVLSLTAPSEGAGGVFAVPSLGISEQGELRIPVLLRADAVGRHTIRLLLLVEAEGESIPKSERRQWITIEEELVVQPSLSLSARPSPSYREESRLLFACALENRSSDALEVSQLRCVAGEKELLLTELVSSTDRCIGAGQLAQLLFALQRTGEVAKEPSASASTRLRLLEASRSLLVASTPSPASRGRGKHGGDDAATSSTVDLIANWQLGERRGEVFALQVPCERPESAPCPLDLHLLAPEEAVLVPPLMVPVTLRIRNASATGPVTFYFVADSSNEVAWLGCERSAHVTLPPQAYHTATLNAYFVTPGVFNLNRFRLFVVAMPPGVGSVPASEQAPLAFAFPFERLIHVRPPEQQSLI